MKTLIRISYFSLFLLAAIHHTQAQPQGLPHPEGKNGSSDPRQILVSAKTIAVVSKLGEVAQTGRWVMDPNPERARNALQKALQAWGRFTIVEDTAKPDLVLLLVEGNRSGFIKKGELFEKLLVFPGGSSGTQQTAVLWQDEAKEGFSGRPAGKLVERLRKQIEEYEKSTAAVVVQPQVASRPEENSTTPPSTATVAVVEAGASSPEQKPEAPAEPKAAQPAVSLSKSDHPAQPTNFGSRLESRMLEPVPEKFVPSTELLTAKTATVRAFGPETVGGMKGVLGSMLTKTPSNRLANVSRAKKDVEEVIRKWNVYALVENAEQADLVIAIREWNHTGILGREHLVSRIAVFKGGTDFEQDLQMLWAEEYETDFGYTTKAVAKDFRRVVEKLGKETQKK
jgi:hypothetical protein